MLKRALALAAAIVMCISGAAEATEAAAQARKNNPAFEDDSDIFLFPGRIRAYDDAVYLGVNTEFGKGIDAGYGGLLLDMGGTTFGLWLNPVPDPDLRNGAAGVPIDHPMTNRALQLLALEDELGAADLVEARAARDRRAVDEPFDAPCRRPDVVEAGEGADHERPIRSCARAARLASGRAPTWEITSAAAIEASRPHVCRSCPLESP